MAAWIFNSNDYQEQSFELVPVGDHRCRVEDVVFKTSRAGNEMYELTLSVSGHNSRLWHYLTLDPNDRQKTNQRIGELFNSFGITDPDLGHYRSWIGKVGAVRVKHEDYNGSTSAKVHYCISKKNQEKLPPAKFNGEAPVASAYAAPTISADELPF